MEAPQETVDELYREQVLRARRAPLSQKMGWGAELFAEVCGRMRSGIRMQFPAASEQEVAEILQQRPARLDQFEEYGFFTTQVKGPCT